MSVSGIVIHLAQARHMEVFLDFSLPSANISSPLASPFGSSSKMYPESAHFSPWPLPSPSPGHQHLASWSSIPAAYLGPLSLLATLQASFV